jgi:ATPase subunit of ABC transporter with duplicated ATPase domains
LAQEPILDENKTVREIVEEGVSEITSILKEYEEVNEAFGLEENYSDADKMDKLMARQGELQDKIDAVNAWELDTKLERAMDALRCPEPETKIGVLSGASAVGLLCAAYCCKSLMFCCLMNLPTTWTPKVSIGWSSFYRTIKELLSL